MATRTGDPSLYVTEQSGRVRAIRDQKLVRRPVLDLQSDTTAAGEQGLLGLAFAPDGALSMWTTPTSPATLTSTSSR